MHTARALKLFFGGLAGGLAATVICFVVFGLISGGAGVASVAISAGIVLFFYCVGQLVMVGFAESGAQTLMAASMASYTGRVVILGLVLLAYQKNKASWPQLDSLAFFVTAIVVVACWLAVEMVVFSRLRIGVYDTEYVAPTDESDDPTDDATGGADRAGDESAPDRAEDLSAGGERHAVDGRD